MTEHNTDRDETLALIESFLEGLRDKLSKLEEAQKNPPQGEDEQEHKWEEDDKFAYERKKEFEIFTIDVKGKMDVIQKALQKTKGVDDYLFLYRWRAKAVKMVNRHAC